MPLPTQLQTHSTPSAQAETSLDRLALAILAAAIPFVPWLGWPPPDLLPAQPPRKQPEQ